MFKFGSIKLDAARYHPFRGREATGSIHDKLFYGRGEEELYGFPANDAAMRRSYYKLAWVDGDTHGTTAVSTVLDSSATLSPGSTVGGGSWVFTSGGTTADDDDVAVTWQATITPVTGQLIVFETNVLVSSAANVGFKIGLCAVAASTETRSTDPTDNIFFVKAKNSAALTCQVRGNNGTAATLDLATNLSDSTFIRIGFKVQLHATDPWGEWWVNGVRTKMTAAQLTQLAAILTTPPTNFRTHVGFVINGTTQRTANIYGLRAFATRS